MLDKMSYYIRVSARALIIQNDAVLLVEFDDESGLHYNLPGGGVKPGETVLEALRREVKEEASVEVEAGPLVFVVDYEPKRNAFWAGPVPALSLVFECQLAATAQSRLPGRPDPHQTAVKWVRLADLETVELLPHVAGLILEYARHRSRPGLFLEEPIQPDRVQRYLKPNGAEK